MAVLTYNITTEDVTRWATKTSIISNLIVIGNKRLTIATDALVDPTVVAPEQAYQMNHT